MLSVVRTKACKRCGGDVYLDSDIYGVYMQCIQCGATYNENQLKDMVKKDTATALRARPASTEKTAVTNAATASR